jgi:hypothetical protein
MFYFDDGIWRPAKKKVTYSLRKTEYDNETDRFINNPAFTDVVVEDNLLTNEEHARLEAVKYSYGVGLTELIRFVKEGILPQQVSEDFAAKVGESEERAVILSAIDVNAMPLENLIKMKSIIRDFEIGAFYNVGEVISNNDEIYIILQAHVSQADWLPSEVPALYKHKASEGVIPDWIQPTGSHDAYNTGDMVTFAELIYESLIDGNVWSPDAYPIGWQKKF